MRTIHECYRCGRLAGNHRRARPRPITGAEQWECYDITNCLRRQRSDWPTPQQAAWNALCAEAHAQEEVDDA